MLLILGFVSAGDYYISDIEVPKIAYEDQNIWINIDLVNNSSLTADIDLDINFYSPANTTSPIYSVTKQNITVSANSTKNVAHLLVLSDTNASNSPHLVRVTIINTDDNPSNNRMQKWITVSKGQRKTPVPDMPIALGLLAGFFVLFIINRNKRTGYE